VFVVNCCWVKREDGWIWAPGEEVWKFAKIN
jgi:hypothetical protein